MHDMELLEQEDFGEPFLGDLVKGASSLLGLGEGEDELPLGEGPLGEDEDEQFLGGLLGEGEDEGMFEDREQFFGAFKKIAGRALPFIKKIAQKAAPLVASAVGGPLGGPLASLVSGALREDEDFGEGFDMEDFGEGFGDMEDEGAQGELEAVLESPLNETQALGEMMAAIASRASTDTEAEAQMGGAISLSLSPEERRALRDVLPAITRGAAVLTRILRRHPSTRSAVPTVVPIVKRTAVILKKRAESGRPVTKKTAAKAMARQTRKVLGTPSICSKAIRRNASATRTAMRR
ncbi:MAG TPA: hypothetical protein VF698_07160, partial [Thermoanaerobaculia bacterium]